MKNTRGILLALCITMFILLAIGCEPNPIQPPIVQSISEMPQDYDHLITSGNHTFVTTPFGYTTRYISLAGSCVGGIQICFGSYEQVWLDNQEDAIWVYRGETSTILNGDIIRITKLQR